MPKNNDIRTMDLAAMSTEELKAEFARGVIITAEALRSVALIWRELEMRDVDMSDLRSGINRYMSDIAIGALAPEAVVAFAGQTRLLDRLRRMPLPQQISLAGGEAVDVLTEDPEGHRFKTLRRPLSQLSGSDLARVITEDGRIAPPTDQLPLLKRRKKRNTTRAQKITISSSGHLLVGTRVIRKSSGDAVTVAELRAALDDHNGRENSQ